MLPFHFRPPDRSATIATIAELLLQELGDAGVRHFYGVQGGACAHLIQAASLGEKTRYVPVLNEQAAGLYAHGAYKATGQIGGVIVTTGPGFYNLMTGIAACYYDRVPLVVLCGQVNAQANLAQKFGTRMYGFQEAEHAAIASHISENTVRVTDRASLSRALSLIRSIHQHTGPLFIEIQDDLQRQSAVGVLGTFQAIASSPLFASVNSAIQQTQQALQSAQRPLILVGAGVDTDSFSHLDSTSRSWGIPILFSWGAQWLINPSNPLHQGIFGSHSPGRGNGLLNHSDLLIAVGISLLQHQVGKVRNQFAPNARILFVNRDHAECSRFAVDFSPRATAYDVRGGDFSRILAEQSKPGAAYWAGQSWKSTLQTSRDLPHVHSAVAVLMKVLEACPNNSTVFSDAGATLSWTYQAANLVPSPALHTAYNLHTMGYAVPAAIGSAIVSGQTTVSISGDGGFMMNLQELALAQSRKVKTVILDNQGYGIIRQTQDDFLAGQHCGSSMLHPQSALPLYDVAALVSAFGIPSRRCQPVEVANHLAWLFENDEARGLVIDIDFKLKVQGVET
jgi:acetolactate synthase-1/2/3 large subunit